MSKNNRIEEKKHPMDRISWKQLIGLFMCAVILGGVSMTMININDKNNEVDIIDSLESRLTNDGWELISSTACPACNSQKNILNTKELRIIDCDISEKNYKICTDMGIEAVPTWYNSQTNMSVVGYHTIEELEELIR